MARVKRGVPSRKRHKKVLLQTRGFRGRANSCFRVAIRKLHKAWQYAYIHRKEKKREFRSLWIIRINAAVREFGLTYSSFMGLLKKSQIELDRKALADLALNEPASFSQIVEEVRRRVAV